MILFFLAAAEIPDLKPMRGEIPPSFFEKHVYPNSQSILILSVLGLAILVALIVWWCRRPKVVLRISAYVTARRALEALSEPLGNKLLPVEVSRVLRRFLAAPVVPQGDELTTAEIREMLESEREITPETRRAVLEFLDKCDVAKFAPAQPAPAPGLVDQALHLVDRVEAERSVAARAAAAPAVPSSA